MNVALNICHYSLLVQPNIHALLAHFQYTARPNTSVFPFSLEVRCSDYCWDIGEGWSVRVTWPGLQTCVFQWHRITRTALFQCITVHRWRFQPLLLFWKASGALDSEGGKKWEQHKLYVSFHIRANSQWLKKRLKRLQAGSPAIKPVSMSTACTCTHRYETTHINTIHASILFDVKVSLR